MSLKNIDPGLQKLVKQLTESGLQDLNRAQMSELLQLCRSSSVSLLNSFRLLFSQLQKRHSEIRWSVFLIIAELFEQFENFRTCLIDKIKHFVQLVVAYDSDKPLPPPKVMADRLSREACRRIAEWKKKYGKDYVQLELMYKYMENVYKINFDSMSAAAPAAINGRLEKIKQLKLQKATEELTNKLVEVTQNTEEFWSCMNLLMPRPDDFDIPLGHGIVTSLGQTSSQPGSSSLREEGYYPGMSLPVVVPGTSKSMEVCENDDNAIVLENLRNCYSVLNKYHLPAIIGLLETISKLGASDGIVKPAIDAKANMTRAKSAFDSLKIKWKKKDRKYGDEDDDDDDNDWVEVPNSKDNVLFSADQQIQQQIVEKLTVEDSTIDDCKESDSNAAIPKLLLAEIPSEDVSCDPAFAKMHSKEDNIWCNSASFDADAPSTSSSMLAEALSTRAYYFVSTEAKVTEPGLVCGAPLGNGKFCPRKDKFKCPFHGPIGKRGCNEQSTMKVDEMKIEDIQSSSAWRDPSLERDISAALGITLTAPSKNRKRTSGVTQLKVNTPKSRIAKRMFHTTAAERVASDMNRRDAKRHHDRFAHSFSYSLSRTL